jgi:hypothetical protein
MSTTASFAGRSPRFLADVNFNNRIVIGLRRRAPSVDIITVQDLGLRQTPDPQVLLEACELDRILVTHDVNTMPLHCTALLTSLPVGKPSPGIMQIAQEMPIGMASQELYEV